jgi:hypothetical protein
VKAADSAESSEPKPTIPTNAAPDAATCATTSAATMAPCTAGIAAIVATHGIAAADHACAHEVTKCAPKKSVFFSKIKNRNFCLFFRANLTVLGVLVGSAGE